MRVLLGFLIAPATCVLVAALWIFLSPGGSIIHDLPQVGGLALWIGYTAAIVLGVPVYLILRWSRRRSFLSFGLAGLLIGIATFEATWPGAVKFGVRWLLGDNPVWPLSSGVWQYEALSGVAGVLAGAVFWAIARPGASQKV